jgi:hypothetical protein
MRNKNLALMFLLFALALTVGFGQLDTSEAQTTNAPEPLAILQGTAEPTSTPIKTPAATPIAPFRRIRAGSYQPPTSGAFVNMLCNTPGFYKTRDITTRDQVYLYAGFISDTRQQIVNFLNAARMSIVFDRKPVRSDWPRFVSRITRVQGGYLVLWFVPLGRLTPGLHRVNIHITFTRKFGTGEDAWGPGTKRPETKGDCIFNVATPR